MGKGVVAVKEGAVRIMDKDCGNNDGFSLLEGLIAIAIFGFGLLAVVTMLDVGFNAGTLSKNMTTSTELAAFMMDKIRFDAMSTTDPFSADLTKLNSFSMDTNASAPASGPGSAAFTEWQQLVRNNLRNGQGIVTIVRTDPTLPQHYTVTVRVTWNVLLTRGAMLESVIIVP